MELHNAQGKVIQTVSTTAQGKYSFPGLTVTQSYYVAPAVDRTQSSSPSQSGSLSLPLSNNQDFKIRGVPATAKVTDTPSTFVLMSPVPPGFAGAIPPTINQASGASAYSAAIGLDNTATLKVPAGAYSVTCWKPRICGGKTIYQRTANTSVTLVPQQSFPAVGAVLTCGDYSGRHIAASERGNLAETLTCSGHDQRSCCDPGAAFSKSLRHHHHQSLSLPSE